ncbi:MAG: circularly permuted type 2 ATP-grasp protein [Candidatus Rokubacteria bacterium]|nr:circularly permuted type 2 ATP-grasp protein [Candidatus Rokubacteria bacterium]
MSAARQDRDLDITFTVRAGNVTLANTPGTGIADDKVIYRFVPTSSATSSAREPLMPDVEILENLGDLVVKTANESRRASSACPASPQ